MSGGVLVAQPEEIEGTSATRLDVRGTRRSSKSVSGTRPPLSTSASSHRALAYSSYDDPSSSAGPSASPSIGPARASVPPRLGLKRRISTPNLLRRSQVPEDEEVTEDVPAAPAASPSLNTKRVFETRARSTSTSIVVPSTLATEPVSPTVPVQPPSPLPPLPASLPTPPWTGMYVTPPSPTPTSSAAEYEPEPKGLFTAAYDASESVISKMLSWTKPQTSYRPHSSHGSDTDSEKGYKDDEEEYNPEDETKGRYWGLFKSQANTGISPGQSYFALPPTPPEERGYSFDGMPQSLPTPAISAQSLSSPGTKRPRRTSRAALQGANPSDGWWVKVYRTVLSSGSGKTAEVLRELGWTVALLAGLFVVSFLLVLYSLSSMPITQLKSMPKSTTDLQLLSAEMRAYMSSGSAGWWHTVGVLTYVGCWKHAWSVPGAVVLNILVGSVFEPVAALSLLTMITACGSLCAYLLSRPLAPLIAVLFPKPLALVRAALAPESVPHPHMVELEPNATVTPMQITADGQRIGEPEDRPNVWRRLLLMRAMGFVPWSGMNVACGVVGVDWRTFWLTTAAGSASWSYVTASVGNILSRLAIPSADADMQGESLTSLLRDPTLIAKLFFLTLLTIVPVLLKKRVRDTSDESEPSSPTTDQGGGALGLEMDHLDLNDYPSELPSPLATSLASFTPTPHVFDLLSFGRQAMRQGVRVVVGSARTATTSARRFVTSIGS